MMSKSKLQYGVENPIHIENPGTDDWHLWERVANGDHWRGFFRTADDALDWVRSHPGNFTINNVPPSTSRRYAIRDGETTVQREKPQRRVKSRIVAPAPAPRISEPLTAKQRELQAAAKVELDRHKRDEAADIAAGKAETA